VKVTAVKPANMKKSLIPALLLVTLAGACATPTLRSLPAPTEEPPIETMPVAESRNGGWAAEPRPEPKLYARDGSVVTAQPAGTVTVTPNSGQSVADPGGEGSRWTLLEQYQSAVKAKEELEVEIQGLTAALEQSEARELELATEVEQLRELVARNGTEVEKLKGESIELASRLTTAQIRRLQAEKLLLEAKLDWKKIQAVINQPDAPKTVIESAPVPMEPGTPAETSK